MSWLVGGLLLFFGMHGFSAFRPQRQALIGVIGEGPYKGLYSMVSLAGFGLVVYGFRAAEPSMLWTPPVWGRYAALALMPFAFVLLAAFLIPGNLRRVTAHPMLWGVMFWAIAHLLANGELATVLLFGSFGLYSSLAVASQNLRGARPSGTRRPLVNDFAVVTTGLFAWWMVFRFHANLFGVPALN